MVTYFDCGNRVADLLFATVEISLLFSYYDVDGFRRVIWSTVLDLSGLASVTAEIRDILPAWP